MGLLYFTVLINFNSFGPLKSTQWVNKGKFILFNWNEINQRGWSLKKNIIQSLWGESNSAKDAELRLLTLCAVGHIPALSLA